jgi:CRP-like cAMP-binding protein
MSSTAGKRKDVMSELDLAESATNRNVKGPRNRVLARLGADDYHRLKPQMKHVKLDYKQALIDPDERIDYVYFMEAGVSSLVTDLREGGVIESGTVGRESFVGTPILLGVERTASRCFVQIQGAAFRMKAEVLLAERQRGGPFAELLLRVTHATMAMLSQCVACNRAHAVEQRMSRWLLMTRDRVDGDTFPLTQEFLAQMLGVHRPAVNIAGGALQRAGLIQYSRGQITIVDRTSLEAAACECYETIRKEFARALAP